MTPQRKASHKLNEYTMGSCIRKSGDRVYASMSVESHNVASRTSLG